MRTYVDTPFGRLHVRDEGIGNRVFLLLHQTPRSMDEFAELVPLLAEHGRVLAMDMLGFGLSPRVPAPQRIEDMAAGAAALLDALGISEVIVIGHHTGAAVAMEIAACDSRVMAVVLSSPPWTDAEFREKHADGPGVDAAEPRSDGTHLTELWQLRMPFYPSDRPDLLDRFIRDALAEGLDPVEGHRACARYVMEERAPLVRCPVLLLGASDDPFAMPDLPRVRAGLSGAPVIREAVIEGGMIPLMEVHASAVAAAVLGFLESDVP